MNYKPAIGDTGTFYPAHFPIDDGYGIAKPPAVRATIERIWTDTCVNLRCENGVLPTSVLVWDPSHDGIRPSGYYFVPDALVHVVGGTLAAPATETKTYADGTTAIGPAPLPETSPTVLAPMTYTFDEFVQYGLANGSKPVTNGMPWSFSFHGRPVTHENDNLYIISDTRSPGGSLHFRRGDTLVIRDTGLEVLAPVTADTTVEAEIVAKGLTAPRVTLAEVEASIASEHYFTAAEGYLGAHLLPAGTLTLADNYVPPPSCLNLLTFCVLVLRNGFTVTGQYACASPENFDAKVGRRIAREDAIRQVWPLLGFELRTRIAEGRTTIADRTFR